MRSPPTSLGSPTLPPFRPPTPSRRWPIQPTPDVSGGGGFVTGSPVAVTATANRGFALTNWAVNGTVQSISPSYTLTLATNLNRVANFTPIPITNTVVAQANPANAGTSAAAAVL